MHHSRLAAAFAACVLGSGAGGLFSSAHPAAAAEAAMSPAANGGAARIMIAEARVTISNIRPPSGLPGAEVTLIGFGFTNDNTVHFGPGVLTHVAIASAAGIGCTADPNCRGGIRQVLVFAVPGKLLPACPPQTANCSRLPRETAPGEYRVFVENENGKSNELRFTVTGPATPERGRQ